MAKTSHRKNAPLHGVAAVATVKLTPRDKKTLGTLVGLADDVVTAAEKRRDPYLDIPARTLVERPLQPGQAASSRWAATRTAGSCSTCRRPRATCRRMLVASGCKQLIEQGKTTSLRGLFYMLKHTIEGTKEETFDDQDECDPIIEDVEVTLNSLREELHLYA